MSITLSIPPAVVQDAREYANAHGTSLNAMIRDYLAKITAKDTRRSEAAKSFRALAASVSQRLNEGEAYCFRRADAYDREE